MTEAEELLELERELDAMELASARDSFAVYCGLQIPQQTEVDGPLVNIRGEKLSEAEARRVNELEALAEKTQAERYIPATHHREIIEKCEALERGYIIAENKTKVGDQIYQKGEKIPFKRLMIFAPPGTAKSTYASVLYPAWYLGRRPTHNVIQGSYNDGLATRFGRRARNTFAGEIHRKVFGIGLGYDQRAAGQWETERGGEYFSFGINTGVTGRRANGIILDDLIKGRNEANSSTVRETTWDTYISDVRTRMFPTTWILYIGTRWHEDDPAGRILPKNWAGESGWVKAKDGEIWYVLCFVAIVENKEDERKDPLKRKLGDWIWPEWFPKSHFEQEKVTQGEYNWASLYKQRPTPLEGGIVKRKYFRMWPYDKALPNFSFILQSYDTAFTDKTINDPTACTVWGLFFHRKIAHVMLLHNWKDWLPYPELRRRVKLDQKTKYGDDEDGRHPEKLKLADIILIEAKGSGISLIQDLGSVGVVAWPYNPNKVDKTARLVATTPFGAAGMIWLLESARNPGHPITEQVEFMNDVLQAGPSSASWDYADTFSQAMLYMRNNRMLEAKIASGEEPPEETPRARIRENPYAQ